MVQRTITPAELSAQLVKTVDCIDPWRWITTYVLDSTGAKNMSVDGSGGAPKTFFYSPPDSYDAALTRLFVYLQASSAMSVDVFGNLAAALGQGVEIKADMVTIATWQSNIDIYTEMYDKSSLANVSDVPVDTTMVTRWTFTEDTNGLGILIPNGKNFEIIINDDLSSLTEFRIKVKGKLIPAS